MTYKPGNLSNSIWNVADSFLYPFLFLALMPFFLSYLGPKLFGVYILSNSVLISLQVFNLGVGYTTMRNIARYRHAGDESKMSETINVNLSIASVLFFITAILGVLVAILVRYKGLFHIEDDLKEYTSDCIALASIVGGLKFSEQVIQYSFKGFERFDLSAGFNIAVRSGGLFINAALVYMGQSVMAMLIANLLVTLLMLAFQIRGLRSIFPSLLLRFEFSRHKIKEELNFGVWIWLQSVVIIITFQTDRYLVTYLGLETLSYYALTATIFNQALVIISSLVPWFAPRIAGMKAKNEDIVPLYKTMQGLIVTIGTLAFLSFFMLSEPILVPWIGKPKFIQLDRYIPFFTVFALFSVINIVPVAFLNAVGLKRVSFFSSALMGILIVSSILIAFYFTHAATGVVMGLITGMALYIPIMHYVLYKINKGRNFFVEVCLTSLPAVMGTIFIFSDSYIIRSISFIVLLGSLWLIYFSKDNVDFKLLENLKF